MILGRPREQHEHGLAVIIVSHNDAAWLSPCLSSLYGHTGELDVDVIVVENGAGSGETSNLLRSEFPQARLITCENRGFSHANNIGLRTVSAPFVLLLNPDTEILDGTLESLVDVVRANNEVGLVGVKQVTPDGELWPTIRRFPNAARAFFEGMGSERFPFRASWLGERELDLLQYERNVTCDWTSGSFMLMRGEALEAVGFLDERFFMYCEEPDLCRRMKSAGWQVRHVPLMTIAHHAGRGQWNPRLAAQEAYARRQYISKHHSLLHRFAEITAMAIGLSLRATVGGRDPERNRARRVASRLALTTLLGLRPPPFGEPPGQAVSAVAPGNDAPSDPAKANLSADGRAEEQVQVD